MTGLNTVLIASIRIALFFGCRLTVLPFLLGEARHASLDDTDEKAQYSNGTASPLELNELPHPATYAGANRNGSSISRALTAKVPRWQWWVQSLRDPHQVSSHVFAICFEESTILFALVLLEATDKVSTAALRRNWTFSLASVVLLADALIPLCVCLLVTFRIRAATAIHRILYAIPAFLLWSFVFVKVPLPSALASSSASLLDSALARTALLGVILIASLSGSAAASAAFDTYDAFFAKRKLRPVTASDLQGAESSFKRTLSDLASQRKQLEQLREASTRASEQSGNFLGKLWGSTQRSKEIKSLQQEIFGLETLASAMRDDLDNLRTRHRDGKWARTMQGKLLLAAGHLFSAYCVWRIALAALSLTILGYRDTAPPDFVSLSLAYLVRFVDVDVDLATWTRLFGLLFVGALIVMRMRVVLAYLSSAFRAVSAGISTSFLVLFLSQVLTIYLLATLIQLRASLPSTYSGQIPSSDPIPDSTLSAGAVEVDDLTNAIRSTSSTLVSSSTAQIQDAPLLATLPSFNVVFGALFDGVFLATAVVTGAVRWYFYESDIHRNDW